MINHGLVIANTMGDDQAQAMIWYLCNVSRTSLCAVKELFKGFVVSKRSVFFI